MAYDSIAVTRLFMLETVTESYAEYADAGVANPSRLTAAPAATATTDRNRMIIP